MFNSEVIIMQCYCLRKVGILVANMGTKIGNKNISFHVCDDMILLQDMQSNIALCGKIEGLGHQQQIFLTLIQDTKRSCYFSILTFPRIRISLWAHPYGLKIKDLLVNFF